jgi:segregation and condensation protein A
VSAPCTVKLPIFEGPLDLLLHLIKRNEVSVTDIPIATITDQYLALLDELPELNLDGAGEYLVMAATLIYIKSRMLLPAEEDEEDVEEDPRAQLVQQLLEYERFREVAVALGERQVLGRDVFAGAGEVGGPGPEGETVRPVREAGLGDLLTALRDVLQRRRAPSAHEVASESFSIRVAVEHILARFQAASEVAFASLFADSSARAWIITTFLALLELIRVGVVSARQPERFGPIMLALAVESLEEASERVRDVGDAGEPAVEVADGGGGEAADGHGRSGDR